MKKKEKLKEQVRSKVKKLLNESGYDGHEGEEHPEKVDKRKGIETDQDKDVLFDEFVQGLVTKLSDYDDVGSQLSTDRLSKSIQNHSVKRMFQADEKDEYYNYKSRYQKAPQVANAVMQYIQNDEEEPESVPKFVDYDNVGYDKPIFEEMGSERRTEFMEMVYEYKKMNESGDGADDFFRGKPESLQEKIKSFAENMEMDEIREYVDVEETHDKENVLDEFRNKIREEVYQTLKSVHGFDIDDPGKEPVDDETDLENWTAA